MTETPARAGATTNDERLARLKQRFPDSLSRHLRLVSDWTIRWIYDVVRARGHPGIRLVHEAVVVPLELSGTRLVDIARYNQVSKSAIGQLANELQTLGYVQRDADPDDARAKRLRFTDAGIRLMLDAMDAESILEEEIVALIGARKCSQFKQLVADLAAAISARQQEAP